jgi:3-deoxy-manno-octulosonate cytidylyltransferase (CMP-KDO synthetase)
MDLKNTLGIIPARYASTRLPGKPLIALHGKTMIQRVYEQAKQAKLLDRVVVATDHPAILEHVLDFGGEAMLSSEHHLSGTDRCAEVARAFPDYEWVVNIQGDEPLIDPSEIDRLVSRLRQIPYPIATLMLPITDPLVLHNPNVVKILVRNDEAIYFSRQALPFVRGVEPQKWLSHHTFFRHIGMYGFRADTLAHLSGLAPSPWEIAESLEQLRWLEAGYQIGVAWATKESISVDTEADAQQVRELLAQE